MSLPHKKRTEEGVSTDVHVIKEELGNVINESLKQGICPERWKYPKASDFWPINVLPVHEKLLEHMVKEDIEHYLERNKLIPVHQSRFKKSGRR